ncbi:MAG: radical SAM protein [Brachymonas sp.]|nr:radical SAM protein [Brachymonas sp.]
MCYLSEHSEAVHDLPLEEIFRRIDAIAQQYGPRTDIQISGGDPTLRDHAQLQQIVAYIREKDMRSSLFTNGILASRELLKRLRDAGLSDVAFHVDMTQQRQGYADERSLNTLRLAYIERARGFGV